MCLLRIPIDCTRIFLHPIFWHVRYIEFLLALDLLARYYPKYHSHELLVLADDIWKWINNELPEDSSAMVYLKRYFNSPAEAFRALWKEIQMLSGPWLNLN